MIIFHNPRCAKSRETLELLNQQCEHVTIREYLKEPPTQKDLTEILKKLSIKPEELIRKKEPLYQEKYKNKKLSGKEWIKVMSENPILIERPIVISGNKAVIGRPPEKVLDIL